LCLPLDSPLGDVYAEQEIKDLKKKKKKQRPTDKHKPTQTYTNLHKPTQTYTDSQGKCPLIEMANLLKRQTFVLY
jgi:hypothetical protein